MNSVKYLHFIISSTDINSSISVLENQIITFFPKGDYKVKISYIKYLSHTSEVTKTAILDKPEVIVACGGNQMINQVATCLIKSDIKFGIVPTGEISGLASILKIPVNSQYALEIIKKAKFTQIDVGKINNYYFFNNAGFGIDALIVKNLQFIKKENFTKYLNAIVKSVSNYKYRKYYFAIDDNLVAIKPFLFFVSNSNEIGYKKSLTPQAILDDGFLDLVIIPKINFLNKIILALKVLFAKVDRINCYKVNLIKQIKIIHDYNDISFQMDGEFRKIEEKNIFISLIPKALQVIVR